MVAVSYDTLKLKQWLVVPITCKILPNLQWFENLTSLIANMHFNTSILLKLDYSRYMADFNLTRKLWYLTNSMHF